MKTNRVNWQQAVAALALAAAGVVVGASLATTHQAHGETTPAPPMPSFQAGDQISVPILRDISATLHQMDARLARLEAAAQKMQMGSGRNALSVQRPAGRAN